MKCKSAVERRAHQRGNSRGVSDGAAGRLPQGNPPRLRAFRPIGSACAWRASPRRPKPTWRPRQEWRRRSSQGWRRLPRTQRRGSPLRWTAKRRDGGDTNDSVSARLEACRRVSRFCRDSVAKLSFVCRLLLDWQWIGCPLLRAGGEIDGGRLSSAPPPASHPSGSCAVSRQLLLHPQHPTCCASPQPHRRPTATRACDRKSPERDGNVFMPYTKRVARRGARGFAGAHLTSVDWSQRLRRFVPTAPSAAGIAGGATGTAAAPDAPVGRLMSSC